MDVVVWLRSLGLGKYEAAFRENEIDETVLPSLTAEDLQVLGVAALGHRRKILDAIAALRADTNASPTATPAHAAVDASPRDTAERRHVTVMFSDLVGSTALSARMDPEDLGEVISAYQKCVAETVGRFGGFVAKYMGDGVLVYFGYPHAHEDDAERAVRAGLDPQRGHGRHWQSGVHLARAHHRSRGARQGHAGIPLRYPYEVRKQAEYFDDIKDEKVPKDMLDLALHIVNTKRADFDPEAFEDQYEDALKALIEKKAKGEKIEPAKERPAPRVVNLMDAG